MTGKALCLLPHPYGVTGKASSLSPPLPPHRYGVTGKSLVTGKALSLLPHRYGVTIAKVCLLPHHYGVTGKALSVCYHIVMV